MMSTATMSKPKIAMVSIGIEESVKAQAEEILNQLGLSLSEAFNLLLRQVTLRKSFPIELKLPDKFPVPCLDDLTEEEFDAMIDEALEDFETGRFYTLEEVEAGLREKYGIEI